MTCADASAPAPEPPDGRPDLCDGAFLAAVEGATMPPASFRHRSHLRLTWLRLRDMPGADGVGATIATIRAYADAIGMGEIFNETLTAFWIRTVAAALRAHPEADSLDALLEAVPELADPGLQYRYWSPEVLKGEIARRRWVEPDKRPLPA